MKPIKFFAIGLEEPHEFIVSWNLGNTCNWSCEYCPSWLNDASVYWTDNELIKKTLLAVKNKFTTQKIRVEFMGGEVTLKPDFIELMEFCREQGFDNHIVTNASRTTDYWERLAPLLDTAILTYHPDNVNTEHYEKIIDIMLKHNARPSCHLAMVKHKFWELTEYKKYLEEKYQNSINVDLTILLDKDRVLNYNGYFYDYDESQIDYFKSEGGKNYVVEYENGERQELTLGEVQDLKLNNFTGFTCGSKLGMLNIDYKGGASISVCPQRNPINIRKHDLNDFLEPRVCQQEVCRNPSDLRIYKEVFNGEVPERPKGAVC